MPTIYVILVADDDGASRVWSSAARSLEEAVKAAKTCAECNPDKTWSVIAYRPAGLPVEFRPVPRG